MATPNKITKIEVFRVPPRWLFVRVDTELGIVGWGESTLEGHTEAVEGACRDLAARFVGWDAEHIQNIWQHAYRARFYRGGPVLMSALSGLDIALWDIKGKRLTVPIHSLLGGALRARLKVYSWVGGDRPSLSLLEAAAAARAAQGFAAVKMNATPGLAWVDGPRACAEAAARVRAVRARGLDVGVDFHGRVHKGMAKVLAKALEPEGPLFIEEPLLPTQPEEIADLARAVSTPIALGERLYSRFDFRPYFERRALDIAQPDVSHCGGISELHRIAALAETYDVALAPHAPIGPISLAACMQVDLVVPNFFIQEMSLEIHYNEGADLLTYLVDPSVFAIKDGYVEALTGPGLGIEINETLVREAAAKHAAEVPWKNTVFTGPDGALQEW